MINVTLYGNMRIRIDTDDESYLNFVKEQFTQFVPDRFHMPKYKAGIWNGSICLFDSMTRSLPYGLLFDLMKMNKRFFPDKEVLIDAEVKALFNNDALNNITYDLIFKPWDYQKDCIETALRFSKCIIRSATASGKSLMISYIIKNLRDNGLAKYQLIIVPSLSLITQFYDDMLFYGIDEKDIGTVWADSKDFVKPYVIGTWQTLSKHLDKLKLYDTVVVDECHGASANEMAKVLKECPNAKFRFGFTGTLPTDTLNLMNVKSYLGPVAKEYSSGVLSKLGYVAKCNVNILNLKYNDTSKYKRMSYDEVKDDLFTDSFRLNVIKNIIEKCDGNILLLVGKVEKEGEVLKKYLNEVLNDREVVFLSGKDKASVREIWRKRMNVDSGICLIATYQIFQQGVNIPSLKYIIFVSPYKSSIRVIQSCGRALRKYSNKDDGAYIFDITDDYKWFKDHGAKRYRYYVKENFIVNEMEIFENEIKKL